MKTIIDYNKITNPVQERAEAMKDIKEYLGAKKFKEINEIFIKDANQLTRKIVRFELSMFVGIDGYPVEAWLDTLGFPHDSFEECYQAAVDFIAQTFAKQECIKSQTDVTQAMSASVIDLDVWKRVCALRDPS